ncbi:MAG TPA: HD-GYP domain-containing protein [Trueperaceae bacterium]|nr:HD-GYP domain-containing protein [Trueperaceae bacterium]
MKDSLLLRRRKRTVWTFSFQALVVAFLVLLCWLVLVWAGAAHFVLVHALYIPILLAAFWFRRAGALATAVVAAYVAGPLLPWDIAPAVYANNAWLIRAGFFLATGALSGHLSVVLDDRYDRLREVYGSVTHLYARTLQGFMRLLEYKDEETSAHCGRVARNALTVGHALGFERQRLETLYWSGYLHDLGKLATPASILLKPSSLTDAEYDVIKQHAAIGAELLVGVSPAFREIAVGVRHHHERWDGRGYPDGLSHRDIPVFGRILSVVDVFEAMTSDRPYRKALPIEEARAILADGAGKQLDPDLVGLFLELEADGKVHIEGRDGKHTGMEAPDTFDPEELLPKGGRRPAARQAVAA